MADPTYGVSGSWISANKQITGGIKGQFVGVLTPTVSGQFTGSLTATVQGAGGVWTTERSFAGPLGQALGGPRERLRGRRVRRIRGPTATSA